MQKQELLYKGKAKKVNKTEQTNQFWIEYKEILKKIGGENIV